MLTRLMGLDVGVRQALRDRGKELAEARQMLLECLENKFTVLTHNKTFPFHANL